ncbi:single-stranded DNA-binding protein [Nocardioides sp. NPDC087217]|uniref:single-stranded DNA-binding protein n=1 Tax=Nocardioides sp. NPDC087217 TaxID=3364335 RepID=UPI003814B6D9
MRHHAVRCLHRRPARGRPGAHRDPNTGTAVAEAVVLINHAKKNGEEWVEGEPTKYYLKAWRRRVEALGSLSKGSSVVVVGHVETESWTGKGDRERRRCDTVVVNHLGETVSATVAAQSPFPTRAEGRGLF